MLYHSPKLSYSGLTVILSNGSRFDNKVLLSANGGSYFADCLKPHLNRFQCDIRLMMDDRPLLPNTKGILLLGEYALRKFNGDKTSINEQRGNPLVHPTGIHMIPTYLPQDTQDMKDYEGEYNEFIIKQEEIKLGAEGAQDEKRRHGKTDRKNYAFWFKKDVEKAIRLVQGEYGNHSNEQFSYHIWPDATRLISLLRSHRGHFLYFDIETDADLNITCFSFSFGDRDVYVVPCLDWNYNLAYRNLAEIFTALAIAFRDNTVVAHNGMGFDFFVMANKYKISIRKVYDTMLAQNRCYPEVEKSLGHCISLPWMYEPYHKNESNFAYRNEQQCRQLWLYCGKDVSSLIQLKKAQDEHAKKHIGLRSSIDSVNSYVRCYLTTTLTGIAYDRKALEENLAENDKKCNAYLKMLDILVGKETMRKLRGKGKGSIASSSAQAVQYFYELLNYPVNGRFNSKKTGRASLSAKAIYDLQLRLATYVEKNGGIVNPVLSIIVAYRQVMKESGTLRFIPFKE